MAVIAEGEEESSDEDLPEEPSDDPDADYNFYPVCISVDKIFQSQRRNKNCTILLKENSIANLAQMTDIRLWFKPCQNFWFNQCNSTKSKEQIRTLMILAMIELSSSFLLRSRIV